MIENPHPSIFDENLSCRIHIELTSCISRVADFISSVPVSVKVKVLGPVT